jgi:hypothetical protein
MPTLKAKQRGTVASSTPASTNNKTVKRTTMKRTGAVPPKTRTAPVSGEIGTDRVAELAYFHWLKRGCPEGSPQEDWLRAEKELKSRK